MVGKQQKQAVIYCRVSDTKQVRDGDGLNSQETRCREFAKRKNYVVTAVFKDDITGKLVDRPGMKAMLAFIRKNRAHGIVVIIDDISRLARGLQAHLELRGAITKAGGTLESPSIEFGEDADSILVEHLLASVSQHHRQKNGEQTKNRMMARVMNGYWVFQAPIGYKFQRVPGRGKMIKRDEPVASVIQEALEGYASGRFIGQADVWRFLQSHPLFPRDRNGVVRSQRVLQLLDQPVFAGYIELPQWGISMRRGQHEPLISLETFQRIQERLKGGHRAPTRTNLSQDFPLRGFVLCHDCGSPLTACWSTGKTARHPYYLCRKDGCPSYKKSIRKAQIEGEFETLLRTARPSETLFNVARMMFEELWNSRLARAEAQAKALHSQLVKIERQVTGFLERILDATVPTVVSAYEDRIRKLEADKHVVLERIESAGRPADRFEETFRTSMRFLANPWKLWETGQLDNRQTVLKLVFVGKLRYMRNEGFRTPDFSLPFNMLANFSGAKNGMVGGERVELPTSSV